MGWWVGKCFAVGSVVALFAMFVVWAGTAIWSQFSLLCAVVVDMSIARW